VGGAGRVADLVHRRVEAAVAQVVGDRAGKERRLLQDDGDPLAQRPDPVLSHVHAVHEHVTLHVYGGDGNDAIYVGQGQPTARSVASAQTKTHTIGDIQGKIVAHGDSDGFSQATASFPVMLPNETSFHV